MKRILRRTAALIAAAVLSVCTPTFNAFAEDKDDPKCPSGHNVSSVIKNLEKIWAEKEKDVSL